MFVINLFLEHYVYLFKMNLIPRFRHMLLMFYLELYAACATMCHASVKAFVC